MSSAAYVMGVLHAGAFRLDYAHPLIMGVVNVTPDSFSDGGRHSSPADAIAHALRLSEEGADILDVGGESTRPGAVPIDVEVEMRRVLPVIEALARRGLVVSVDTRHAEIMRAAVAAGAAIVNDVAALREEGAMEAVASTGAAVCLMHMQGTPATMQEAPQYADVAQEVRGFLESRVQACIEAGIARERMIIDPGFGFGKDLAHNLRLLRRLSDLSALGLPVLAGSSRKKMLGQLTGRGVGEREYAGIAAHLAAVARGAKILRVHHVAAMRDALAVWNAIEGDEQHDDA